MTKARRSTGAMLSDKAVARLVKATAAGAALPDLMRQTRHKSTQVALAYLRPADLWRNNVTKQVFATRKNAED